MDWRKKIWAQPWPVVIYYGCRDRRKPRNTSDEIDSFDARI
jgi:hypothetical protein